MFGYYKNALYNFKKKCIIQWPLCSSITQINRARDIVRITVSCLIMLLFVIAVPFYMAAGRRTRDRGETEWRKSKEWVAKLRKDKLAEEARLKAEEDAASSS